MFQRLLKEVKYLFFTKAVWWIVLAIVLIIGFYFAPDIVPNLIGGLGLFLFGMVIMSDGLQAIAGAKMRKVLATLTENRVAGVFTGFGVTAVIQSSSATTVMVVGFVNARLMTLRQAIGVILGANIGTTITAHMIALNLTDFAAPILGIAVFIVIFAKKPFVKNLGNSVLGFGMLFLGMLFMKEAVAPLRDAVFFKNLMMQFDEIPFYALLTGMGITMAIQSSSATEGLIASMALTGVLPVHSAIPMLLGSNIGTTITAQIAAIVASRNAKRAAWVHTFFNVIGVGIVFVILPLYIDFVRSVVDNFKTLIHHEPNPALYLAWAHTLFNVLNCLLFLPFVKALEKITKKIIPVKDYEADEMPDEQEKISLTNPLPMLKLKVSDKSYIKPVSEFYLPPAIKAIHKMLEYAKKAINSAKELVANFDKEKLRKTQTFEQVLDICQIQLNKYIEKAIIAHEKGEKLPIHVGNLHHAVNDIERIGDIALSLSKRALVIKEYSIEISEEVREEMLAMFDKVLEMFDYVLAILQNGEDKQEQRESADKAYALENEIDEQLREFRKQLRDRPKHTDYGWYIANISDIYSDLENVGDKLKNVIEAFGFPEIRKTISPELTDADEQN